MQQSALNMVSIFILGDGYSLSMPLVLLCMRNIYMRRNKNEEQQLTREGEKLI